MPCMSSIRRLTIAGAAAAASLGFVTASTPSFAAHAGTHVIRAQNFVFTPEHLSIRRGDRVTWRFLDAPHRAKHTVTSVGPQRFKDLPDGRLTGSFTVRFAKPGRYRFMCTFHPISMNGVIVVR